MEECGAQHPCEYMFLLSTGRCVFPLRVLRKHCSGAFDDVQHKTGILKKSIILGAAAGTHVSHFWVFVSYLCFYPLASYRTFSKSFYTKTLTPSWFCSQLHTFHIMWFSDCFVSVAANLEIWTPVVIDWGIFGIPQRSLLRLNCHWYHNSVLDSIQNLFNGF